MQLVMLAAGFGTRFGGLKQLAPVGPNGEAIMDYTAGIAAAQGFDGAVVVIRQEIDDEMRAHIKRYWPPHFPVEFVYQPVVRGTAAAVLAAASCIKAPFAVANADDLYGNEALGLLISHFSPPSGPADERHLLVAYRLHNTVLAGSPLKRGLCEMNGQGELERIEEHLVYVTQPDRFEGAPLALANAHDAPLRPLSKDAWVSTNLWGFHPRIFEHLSESVHHHQQQRANEELLLPDVIEDLVSQHQETVRVVVTESRCVGITHRDDLDIVRGELNRMTLAD